MKAIRGRALVVPAVVLACGALLLAAAPKRKDQAQPMSPVKAGLLLFNDTALSGSGKYACATCHPRGGHTDNKTYVGLDVVKDGTPEGRSVPLLYGVKDTAPFSWAGGKTL